MKSSSSNINSKSNKIVVGSSVNIRCKSIDNSTTAASINNNNNNIIMNKEASEMLLFIITMDLSSIYKISHINNATIAPVTTIDNSINKNYVNAHNS